MDHPVQTDFLRWIVLFPLLGAAVNGLLGARIQERAGKRMVAVIACAPVTLSFLFSLWAFGPVAVLAGQGAVSHRPLLQLDPHGLLQRGRGLLGGSAVGHHDPGGERHRRTDPLLLHRLHARGPVLVALLRLPEPVHLLHAAAGDRRQPAADVRGLGGSGAVLVGAHRVLVHGPHQHPGRQQGLHRQPRRRLRLHPGHLPALLEPDGAGPRDPCVP